MPEGTIKFFNRAKGFGFIVPDDGDKEVFLPPAAVTGAGGAKLSPGQRVSFEIVADPKGPKAASLTILEGVVPVAPKPQPQMAPRPQQAHAPVAPPPVAISLYCDPSSKVAQDVIAALEAQNQHAQVIDMMTAPPTALQLRKWSPLLAEMGQGLVRRTMPLFFDLQLDDRFIHEDEFWTAVVQHPALINGPILVVRERVRICKSAGDVKAFFTGAGNVQAAQQSKNISSRLMAMMRGEEVGPRPPREPEPEPEEDLDIGMELEIEDEDEDEVVEAPAPTPAKKVAAPARPAKAVKEKPAAKPAKPAAKKVAAKPAARKAAPAKKKAK